MGNESNRMTSVNTSEDCSTDKNTYDGKDRITTLVFNLYVGGVHVRERKRKKNHSAVLNSTSFLSADSESTQHT